MAGKRVALLVALVLIFVSVGPAASSTVPGLTFTVSPAKLEISGQPGQTVNTNMQLVNRSSVPITLTGSVRDYYIRPDNSFIFLRPGQTSYSSAKWIHLDQNRVFLKPHEIKTVKLNLRVPNKVEPGGHYAVVFFQTERKKAKKSGVSVVGRIGVLILTTVGDKIVQRASVKDFSVSTSWLHRLATPELVFHNAGNVHLNIKGRVTFKDYFGRSVTARSFPDITILPKTDRILAINWRTPFFGRFTAQAKIKYGPNLATYNRTKVTKPITFWIIPWPFIIGALVLLLGLAIWWRRRRASRRRPGRCAAEDKKAA